MKETILDYWKDTYNMAALIRIQATGRDESGFYFIPDNTIFYPGGGGQMKDIGYLVMGKDFFPISGTAFNNGMVKHYLGNEPPGLITGSEYVMQIDRETRLASAGLHTAGHWLAGLVCENLRLDLQPVKAYHYADGPYVEFAGDPSQVTDEEMNWINLAACYDRQAGFEVFSENVSDPGELLARSNVLLPANFDTGIKNQIRLVTIETYKSVPCGGTHVSGIREIKGFKATKYTVKNGKLRISYQIRMPELVAS